MHQRPIDKINLNVDFEDRQKCYLNEEERHYESDETRAKQTINIDIKKKPHAK